MAIEKIKILGALLELCTAKQHCHFGQFGPIMMYINWLDWQCCFAGSSKAAPRIFIFSIVLGAENLSYVKSIETHAHRCDGLYFAFQRHRPLPIPKSIGLFNPTMGWYRFWEWTRQFIAPASGVVAADLTALLLMLWISASCTCNRLASPVRNLHNLQSYRRSCP